MVKVECANCDTVYKLNNKYIKKRSFIDTLKKIFSFLDTLYFWTQIGQRLINFLVTFL